MKFFIVMINFIINIFMIVLLNHFSNDRLLHIPLRKHTMFASTTSGVSDRSVPKYIKDQFINVADGVDVRFFDKSLSSPLSKEIKNPLVILPARIIKSKGHLDLIKAISINHPLNQIGTIDVAKRRWRSNFLLTDHTLRNVLACSPRKSKGLDGRSGRVGLMNGACRHECQAPCGSLLRTVELAS